MKLNTHSMHDRGFPSSADPLVRYHDGKPLALWCDPHNPFPFPSDAIFPLQSADPMLTNQQQVTHAAFHLADGESLVSVPASWDWECTAETFPALFSPTESWTHGPFWQGNAAAVGEMRVPLLICWLRDRKEEMLMRSPDTMLLVTRMWVWNESFWPNRRTAQSETRNLSIYESYKQFRLFFFNPPAMSSRCRSQCVKLQTCRGTRVSSGYQHIHLNINAKPFND